MMDIINSLIEINNDRVVGYETATTETLEPNLHTMFGKAIQTSKSNITALDNEVEKFGGETEKATRSIGKLHRAWMEFKSAFVENNSKSILISCSFGDETALKIYNDVLDNDLNEFTTYESDLIKNQQKMIKLEYNNLKVALELLKD